MLEEQPKQLFKLGFKKSIDARVSVEIDRPVVDVFAFVVTDFLKNYPKWALEVVAFKPINGNPMAVGALAKQVRKDQGHEVETVFEIANIEENRYLALNGLSDPFESSYELSETAPAQTRLTISFRLMNVDFFMQPFAKLIKAATEEGLYNSAQNIKKLLENYRISEPN